MNLGHSGDRCSALAEPQKIHVVDNSGQHIVRVCFCKCSKHGFLENFRQLLRLRLYPASAHSPKTVSTFDFLDTYHKISLQGKLNLYDFYNTIMRKTNNSGGSTVTVGEVSQTTSTAAYHSLKVSLPRDVALRATMAPPQVYQARCSGPHN